MISYSWTHIKTIMRGRDWSYRQHLAKHEIEDIATILTFFYESPPIYTCTDKQFEFMSCMVNNSLCGIYGHGYLKEYLIDRSSDYLADEHAIQEINSSVDIIRNDSRRCRNTMWFIEYLLVLEYDITNISVNELTSLKPIYHMLIRGLGDISDQDYDDIMLLATMYYDLRHHDEYKKGKYYGS